jgi:hypothetical protein
MDRSPAPRPNPRTGQRHQGLPYLRRGALAAAKPSRSVVTLEGIVRSHPQLRNCRDPGCQRRGIRLRPEPEGRFALPHHELGLDVIALVGRLRHAEHRSIPEIHTGLTRRGVATRERAVTNLPDRYDELLALSCSDAARLKRVAAAAGRVALAIDGLRPDVGHEVLWVLRDVLSGEVLPAKSLLSSTQADLAKLSRQVKDALSVPIAGVVSDGQSSIREAVAQALDGVPHQLRHFHYLREAAKPVHEADRPAKVQLKKKVRDIRPIGRKLEGRDDPEAEAIRGYRAAVRSALTDDGRAPLEAPGLKLAGRPSEVAASPGRVAVDRGSRKN